jgi:hypothetical protein
VDIVFVVIQVLCELYATSVYCTWSSEQSQKGVLFFTPGDDGKCIKCVKTEEDHIDCTHIIEPHPGGGTWKLCLPTLTAREDFYFCPGPDGKCLFCTKTEGNHVLGQGSREHDKKYCHSAKYQFLDSDADKDCLTSSLSTVKKSEICCRTLLVIFCIVAEIIVVFVIIGCTMGKLFPPSLQYIGCSSSQCQKVVHNAILTLVCFPFDLVEAYCLLEKVYESPLPTRRTACFKVVQIIGGLGYLIYDARRENTPGPGSTVLVVMACLSEALLLVWEFHTLRKNYKTRECHSTGQDNMA